MILLRLAVIAALLCYASSQSVEVNEDDDDDDLDNYSEDDNDNYEDGENDNYAESDNEDVLDESIGGVVVEEYVEPSDSERYNILALVPYNGKSHFDFAEVLFEELARRGHNLTVVSHFPKKRPFPNYHDISMESPIADSVHNISIEEATSTLTILEVIGLFKKGLDRVCREGLAHPNVQRLLESDEQYDVLIVEMFNADCFLGFVDKFKAPHVSFRTSVLSTWLVGRTGVPDNPAYVPSTTGGYPSRMRFYERLCNAIWTVIVKVAYRAYNVIAEEVARKHFGDDMPDLQSIAQNTTLYLINTHFVNQYPRPLLPNVKEVAGLHLRPTRPLPWVRYQSGESGEISAKRKKSSRR